MVAFFSPPFCPRIAQSKKRTRQHFAALHLAIFFKSQVDASKPKVTNTCLPNPSRPSPSGGEHPLSSFGDAPITHTPEDAYGPTSAGRAGDVNRISYFATYSDVSACVLCSVGPQQRRAPSQLFVSTEPLKPVTI